MKLLEKEALKKEFLPGRIIQKCVGKDSPFVSAKMTMGFASYCAEAGPMEPHHHAEEIVYVIRAEKARVRYGGEKDRLLYEAPLKDGMTMHFDELEWHVFEYDEGGYLDAIFFYGQTENIRPEEIIKK